METEDRERATKDVLAQRRLESSKRKLEIVVYNEAKVEGNDEALINSYVLVIDGCDDYATRYLIDEVCARLQRPYIYGSIGEFSGQASVFNYGRAGRYIDLFPDREYLEALPKAPIGVVGSIAALIGYIEALEAVKIITGCAEPLCGKLYTIDMRTLQTELLEI